MQVLKGLNFFERAGARSINSEFTVFHCAIDVWNWAFDGNFQRHYQTLSFEILAIEDSMVALDLVGNSSIALQDKSHVKIISDLDVFPMQFAPAKVVDTCRRRGMTFWKCRTRRYVSYQDSEQEGDVNLVSLIAINRLYEY